MMDSPPPSGRWRRRLLALGLSSMATLLVCEVLCRFRVQRLNRGTLEQSLSRPVTLSAEGQATLGDIIQLSENDRIAYELRPGLEGVIFKDRPLTTNTKGYRSAEIPLEPAANELTIVAIGDSILFGHGVADGECYLDQLQALLAERHPERGWRVVNTGVPGYNTVMEVETLARKGLAFSPDLVLVGVCGNDYDPPVYVRDPQDPWDLSRSYLVDFLREKLGGGDGTSNLQRTGLVHRGEWTDKEGGGDGTTAPRRYADLYGIAAFEDAVRRLADLQREAGFATLALANITYAEPPFDQINKAREMLGSFRSAGIHALDLQPLLNEALLEATGRPFSIEDYKVSDLVVSENNLHPSIRQHGMIAQALYAELERSGVLADLLDR